MSSKNETLIRNEPDKIQSYFVLGYLLFKKSGNLPMALEHFQCFLKKAEGQPKFKSLIREAETCMQQIERGLEQG